MTKEEYFNEQNHISASWLKQCKYFYQHGIEEFELKQIKPSEAIEFGSLGHQLLEYPEQLDKLMALEPEDVVTLSTNSSKVAFSSNPFETYLELYDNKDIKQYRLSGSEEARIAIEEKVNKIIKEAQPYVDKVSELEEQGFIVVTKDKFKDPKQTVQDLTDFISKLHLNFKYLTLLEGGEVSRETIVLHENKKALIDLIVNSSYEHKIIDYKFFSGLTLNNFIIKSDALYQAAWYTYVYGLANDIPRENIRFYFVGFNKSYRTIEIFSPRYSELERILFEGGYYIQNEYAATSPYLLSSIPNGLPLPSIKTLILSQGLEF